ncbi:hypothetical protein LSH36_13g07017 [Paralvinella palmiformis]|uniref:Uncharacterized protein n=1 Tax=Paralvinella palmiformis TaxID=53620 RepID=A0AAD9KC02_9ANNE|nr:hypothetical protein LSH36_13g07017 [Paralvinella palmiformis]
MRRSKRRNNLQICPRRYSNTGGSDLWSSMLPLDHGGSTGDSYYKIVCVGINDIQCVWLSPDWVTDEDRNLEIFKSTVRAGRRNALVNITNDELPKTLTASGHNQLATLQCSGTHFYGRVNQSPHDNIAAPGDSNQRPFGYESYTLTALSRLGLSARERMQYKVLKEKESDRQWNRV